MDKKKYLNFTFKKGFVLIGVLQVCSLFSVIFAEEGKTENNKTVYQVLSNPKIINNENLKISFLTDGLFSDAGWGAFGYNAAREVEKKYGYQIDFKENVKIKDIESTLKKYAKDGYDLIISHGFEWGKPTLDVAKNFPQTNFIVFTGLVNATNVASIFPMQQEGSYLLGALAAMMSKTGVIGFIGGEEYPNLINILEGYKLGALSINPDIRILSTFLNEWDIPYKGKKGALDQINRNADFILQVADTSGHGVIEAGKEHKIFVFGSISDQHKLAPNTILTSLVLDVEKTFDQIIRNIQNQNFSGQIFKPGLEFYKGSSGDGIVYLAPFYSLENNIPEKVKIKLDKLKNDIINGNLIVPERYEKEDHSNKIIKKNNKNP
ncbi:MAG: BMP family protein [Nitrososphaeraceae archaeon]